LGLASGLLISAGVSGAALAADMDMKTNADMAVKARPAPMSSWTGLYGGVNGGGAFGNTTGTLSTFTTAPVGADFTGVVNAGGTPRNLGAKHDGGFGGALLTGRSPLRDRSRTTPTFAATVLGSGSEALQLGHSGSSSAKPQAADPID